MKRRRQVEDLEGSAAPRAVVLRWLAEAHAFPTLNHYLVWLLGQRPGRWPVAQLPRRAAAHARRTMRGALHSQVQRAERDAVDETIFLVELVMVLNATIDERQRLGLLRCRLRVAEMAELALEPDDADSELSQAVDAPPIARREAEWHRIVAREALELVGIEGARRLLEQRYLGGQEALFPLTADRWEAAHEAASEIARLAVEVLGPIEVEANGRSHGEEAMVLASRMADSARAATLGLLGDAAGAWAASARVIWTASRMPS